MKTDKYSKEYYKLHTEHQAAVDLACVPSFKWIKDHLEVIPGDKILDAGCGTGHLLDYCCDGIAEGFGVDVSKVAIDLARSRYPKMDLSVQDLSKLSFPDNFFDKIISFNVIEHISGQDSVMKELKRVLKPNGTIIMGTNDKDSISWRIFAFFIGDPTHVKEFNEKGFVSFVGQFFGVVEHAKSSCVMRLPFFVRWVFHTFLKGDTIVKARKIS
jgi:SAM-dependent methyltransferase